MNIDKLYVMTWNNIRIFALTWGKSNPIDVDTVIKSFKKCGISNSLDGMEDDSLWEEEAEIDMTWDSQFEPYDDCFTNISQDVINELMISDDEHDNEFVWF